MSDRGFSIIVLGLLGWLFLVSPVTSPLALKARETRQAFSQSLLVNQPDGVYQLCSEPDPQDWQDGAGVCLNIVKQDNIIDGYYGYPHSDSFICLRGAVSKDEEGERVIGQGMVITWGGRTWSTIPQEPFAWDDEGRLSLAQGEVVQTEGSGDYQTTWIVFQDANLNVQGFYPYEESRMTSPSQLCDWPESKLTYPTKVPKSISLTP